MIDPHDRRQTWRGVGASLTDASLGLLAAHPQATRTLFDAAAPDGAHLSWIRLPLSSTDFSHRVWSWNTDDGPGAPVPEATSAADFVARTIVPLQPQLSVIAVPWSAPAAFKTSATLRGGSLRPDAETAYARLLRDQVAWLQGRGVPLKALSLGNEPFYESDYTSMGIDTAQQVRLADAVAAPLRRRHVELWAVDHNWSHRAEYDEVLGGAPHAFAAAAVHCYGGTPGRMAGLAVPTILTECTGTNDGWRGTFTWDAVNLVARSIEAGSGGLFAWNLVLDGTHGPVDIASTQGCRTCRGLLTIDGSRISAEPEFYTLAHLARSADPGAQVVDVETNGPVVAAAFVNPDGEVGVFAHNPTEAVQTIAIRIRGRNAARYEVGPGELLSARGPGVRPDLRYLDQVVQRGGQRFLVDQAGFRHPVTDPWVRACLGPPVAMVATIAAFPLGEPAACPLTSGDVVYSTADGASYLVTGAVGHLARHWMPTAASYYCVLNAGYSVIHGPTYVARALAMGADLPADCTGRSLPR